MFGKRHSFHLSLRVIAALLLTAIVWGSSLDLNHSHAALGTNLSVETAANFTGAAPSDRSNDASVQDTQPGRSSSRQNTASECLICQLHHNLATTLLSEPANVNATEGKLLSTPITVALQLSEFTANQHGRAPPSNL